MKNSRITLIYQQALFRVFAVSLLSPVCVEATMISLPTLSASWSKDTEVGQPHVETESNYVVDIDDRSGLVPGQPIQLTISSPDNFLWVGGFHLAGGNTTISAEANLSLLLGGESVSTTATLFQDFGEIPAGGTGVSDPVGYIVGPVLPDLVIVVPWETDLANATLVFKQDSEITGDGNYFNYSSVSLTGGIVSGESQLSFSLQSIPEPSSALLLSVAGMMVSFRRRRVTIGR